MPNRFAFRRQDICLPGEHQYEHGVLSAGYPVCDRCSKTADPNLCLICDEPAQQGEGLVVVHRVRTPHGEVSGGLCTLCYLDLYQGYEEGWAVLD